MDKIISYEQIQGFVGEIRNLRQGFITNFFWDAHKHPYWIEAGDFFYERAIGCCLLLHQSSGFCNLFYIATDMIAVTHALSQMTFSNACVMDVVCKDGEEDIDALKGLRFEVYKRLYRMSHIGLLADDSWEESEDVVHADENDAFLVYDTLQRDFDPLCEQLPTFQEVKDFAQREQLLVIKDHDKLCGFLIYEMAGNTSWYLRYWYTSVDYRNQRIGAKLLKTALVKGKQTKRQQLWVISDNDNAIKRYEHYGFHKEPINDIVLLKTK